MITTLRQLTEAIQEVQQDAESDDTQVKVILRAETGDHEFGLLHIEHGDFAREEKDCIFLKLVQ